MKTLSYSELYTILHELYMIIYDNPTKEMKWDLLDHKESQIQIQIKFWTWYVEKNANKIKFCKRISGYWTLNIVFAV